MRHLPGFVSANIHLSTDRTRVVNYAQWESAEAYSAMLADPTAREHMSKAAADRHGIRPAPLHRRIGARALAGYQQAGWILSPTRRRRQLLITTRGQVLLDGLVDPSGRGVLADVREQQRAGQ